MGGYKKYHIPSAEEIMHYSELLEGKEILAADYKLVLKRVAAGDFVYLDPPYMRTKRTQFVQYNFKSFNESNLNELEENVSNLNNIGAYFILTNRYCDEIMARFERFSCKLVVNSWPVNREGKKRKGQQEILIRNY